MPRKRTGRPSGRPPYPDVLTPAEQRVLELVRQGLTNAEMAVRLGISPDGVKYHVSNMLSKLQLERREQLALWQPSRPSTAKRVWTAIPLFGRLTGLAVGAITVGAVIAVAGLRGNASPGIAHLLTDGIASVGNDGQPADGDSTQASLSRDGRFVAFQSNATNLVPGNTKGQQVFVRDRLKGTTFCVSVSSNGEPADGPSGEPSISSDGRFVAFTSTASNLVAGAAVSDNEALAALTADEADAMRQNQQTQPLAGSAPLHENVYVHDLQTHRTELVSVALDGRAGNLRSSWPSISANGRFVAFQSAATNLVERDTNSGMGGIVVPFAYPGSGIDVFVRDRETVATTRVSVRSDGAEADGSSGLPSISADGSLVAFVSDANNLRFGVEDGVRHLHIHDLKTGETWPLPIRPQNVLILGIGMPAVSANGETVVARVLGAPFPARPGPPTPGSATEVETFDRLFVFKPKSGEVTAFGDGNDGGGFLWLTISGDAKWAITRYNGPAGGQPRTGLALVDLRSGDRTELPEPPGKAPNTLLFSPALSPDGTAMAFSAGIAGHSQVYVQSTAPLLK